MKNDISILPPDEQIIQYGKMLRKLIFLTDSNSIPNQPIFSNYWQGEFERTFSFYISSHTSLKRYDADNVPPIANLTDAIHIQLRGGTSKLPKVDEKNRLFLMKKQEN